MLPNRNLVLVVDDDLGTRKGVKRLLRQYGYDSVLFPSAEALRNYDDFDAACCLVLDINLDRESGIELRHRLKASGISLPVIYITANDNPAVRTAALASGCIAYLTKPFAAKSLLEPIGKASAGLAVNSGHHAPLDAYQLADGLLTGLRRRPLQRSATACGLIRHGRWPRSPDRARSEASQTAGPSDSPPAGRESVRQFKLSSDRPRALNVGPYNDRLYLVLFTLNGCRGACLHGGRRRSRNFAESANAEAGSGRDLPVTYRQRPIPPNVGRFEEEYF